MGNELRTAYYEVGNSYYNCIGKTIFLIGPQGKFVKIRKNYNQSSHFAFLHFVLQSSGFVVRGARLLNKTLL